MWPFSTSSPSSSSLSSPRSSNSSLASSPESQAEKLSSPTNPLNPNGIKPCCACPDTKRVRDDCFLQYGPPDEGNDSIVKCADLIQAHKACMASYGFKL